jgi:hypothetical membrane protein
MRYSLFGIIGGIFGMIYLLISIGLYCTDKRYDVVRQPLSDLGWGKHGSEYVFRIGSFITVMIHAPYIVFLSRMLIKKASKMCRMNATPPNSERTIKKGTISRYATYVALYMSILSLVGICLVAFFNDHNGDYFYMHLAGAVLFMATETITILSYTYAMTLQRISTPTQITLAGILLLCSFALLGSIVPVVTTYDALGLFSTFKNSTHEDRELLTAKIFDVAAWFPLTEFVFVILVNSWFIMTAFKTLRIEDRNIRLQQSATIVIVHTKKRKT